jgi:hypothetical protein
VHGGSPRFAYPNGIAVDGSRGRIYVAHMEGISTFPLAEGHGSAGSGDAKSIGGVASGIDGLYSCGETLLAIQSLLDFQQVVQFELGMDGDTITGFTVLERKHPAHAAATTAAIAGDTLYYIASSQLGRLLPDGSVRRQEGVPRTSVILRLPLGGACGSADAAR